MNAKAPTPRKYAKGTHVDFPAPLHDALRLAAFNARLPIAEVVRQACAAYLAKSPTAQKEVGK